VDARPIVARSGPGDAGVAAIAAKQHGSINAAQLRFVGLDRKAVSRRKQHGLLHPKHRGVYAVGHGALGELGEIVAALLAIGPGGSVSHQAAAFLAKTLPSLALPIDVSVARSNGHRRSRSGITVHQPIALQGPDVTRRGIIPFTSPARTLIDLAETDFALVEPALNEGRAIKAFTQHDIDRALVRSEGRLGAKRVSALLASESDPGFSRSEAERILRGLLRRAGFPPARRNSEIHKIELDFYWPDEKLNVEFDGFGTHGQRRRNFESDRDRDGALAAKGIQVIRVTWWQLTREAPKVVARIAAALALRGA